MSGSLDWIFWLVGGLVGPAGLALLAWSLFADRARGRARCPRCWYDLSGSRGLRCSECGYVSRRARAFLKTRRRWRWALAGAMLIAVGYEIAVTPRIQRDWRWHGWRGMVPTTVLLLALPWVETESPLASALFTRTAPEEAWAWQRAWHARFWESKYQRAEGQARGAALEAMAIVGGPAAKGSLPTVFSAARDNDPAVRLQATYALGMILRDSEASISLLVELLLDENANVRETAAWALWKFGREIGRDARVAVPALTANLQDESGLLRLRCAMALSQIADDPAPAMRILIELLKDPKPLVRIGSAHALAELGPAARQAIPDLEKLLGDPDQHVRLFATYALENIVGGVRDAD